MVDSDKLTALKKAYAEIILNTGKEAAARIMLSERKAERYRREVVAAKDEALRMLLRLKHMLDSKASEVAMTSMIQCKRIEELEAQLGEAEDIVKDLRTELRELQDELEMATNNERQLLAEQTSEIQIAAEVLEENRLSTAGSGLSSQSTDQCEQVVSLKLTNYIPAGVCRDNKCCSQNGSHTDSFFLCNPEFASIAIRRKEPELYRNGCTQRIRASERSLHGGSLSLAGKADGAKNRTDTRDCEDVQDRKLATEFCGIEKSADDKKVVEAVGNGFQACALNSKRVSQCTKLPHHGVWEGLDKCSLTKPMHKKRAELPCNLTKPTSKKRAELPLSLTKPASKKRSVLLTSLTKPMSKKRREQLLCYPANVTNTRYKNHKASSAKTHPEILVDHSVQSGEDLTRIDDKPHKDSNLNVAQDSILSPKGIVLPGSVDVTSKDAQNSRFCADPGTSNNETSAVKLELNRQGLGSATRSDNSYNKLDIEMAGMLSANSDSKESSEPEVLTTHHMANKFLKYTFQRKRKRELPSSPDGEFFLGNSFLKRLMEEKQCGSQEVQKPNLKLELSGDNRRLAQVAHQQLISLSEKKRERLT